jgi:predicted AlkP superfamily pyrophosphatase or phosphodiesterase
MAKFRHIALCIALGASSCVGRIFAVDVGSRNTVAGDETAPAPLLLISLDGFRWDYCDKYADETPNLRRLRREGAYAHSLISVFPSNTFADHYTIATGLWPEHHGIINNIMYDAKTQKFFHYNQASSVHASEWWGGEPIWITAVKQGFVSACYFWPGSEAEIEGVRPTYWKNYDYSIPFERRVDEVVSWFQVQPSKRPRVVTFYLEETNSVGHKYGPNAPEMAKAVKLLDTRIGRLLARLAEEKIDPNVVIVSDHGMTDVNSANHVPLDRYLDMARVQVDFDGPVAGLRPTRGATVDEIMAKLKDLPPGARAYRTAELPARFHCEEPNPRIPPIWILPAEGGWADTQLKIWALSLKLRGDHGYDPAILSMQGTLIVHGPAFRHDGAEIPSVDNVNLYNLFCAVAHLRPARNDGDDRLLKELLR